MGISSIQIEFCSECKLRQEKHESTSIYSDAVGIKWE